MEGIEAGATVISYRGTNSFGGLFPNDIFSGWAVGAGILSPTTYAPGAQGQLALDFYQSVTGQNALSTEGGNAILTGHSLGGGLAGLIASLSGDEAVVFDSMPYGAAATALSIWWDAAQAGIDLASYLVDGVPPANYVWPTAGNISSHNVAGEVLTGVRAIEPFVSAALFSALSPVYGALIGTNAGYIYGSQPVEVLETHLGISGLIDPISMHSQQLLPILLFAKEDVHEENGTTVTGHTDWTSIAPNLFKVWFDTGFASSIVELESIRGAATLDSALRYVIAYSALDEGMAAAGKPFGDAAIRIMFDDADELGKLVSSGGASATLSDATDGLSQAIVHFATLMGLRKIELADHPEIRDGILHISEPGESGYAGVDRILTVNFDSMLWGAGAGENGANAEYTVIAAANTSARKCSTRNSPPCLTGCISTKRYWNG